MKKWMVCILLTMGLVVAACGKNEPQSEDSSSLQSQTETMVSQETEETTTEMTTEMSGVSDSGRADSNSEEIAVETEENSNDPLPELGILDEIDKNTTVGTAGSSLKAVQSAVMLLDWGTSTGLDPQEIRKAAVAWLSDKGNDEQVAFSEKMMAVDNAYQQLIGDNPDAKELLVTAGCADASYPWSDTPVESIEAIMDAVGLR